MTSRVSRNIAKLQHQNYILLFVLNFRIQEDIFIRFSIFIILMVPWEKRYLKWSDPPPVPYQPPSINKHMLLITNSNTCIQEFVRINDFVWIVFLTEESCTKNQDLLIWNIDSTLNKTFAQRFLIGTEETICHL